MRVLVAGGGGRESALAWALSRGGHDVLSAPGNPGMAELGPTFPVGAEEVEELADLAAEQDVDLVVVGPEAPLVAGISDSLAARGIPCYGPGRDAAALEGSKWHAKVMMSSAGVPTADGATFSEPAEAMDYMAGRPEEYVIKADGLAAGKGVFLPEGREEAREVLERLAGGGLGDSGLRFVVEKRLRGREMSFMAVCNGREHVLLPPSRDHKRALEGDRGPNTGGMGAVCPPPDADPELEREVSEGIIAPVLREMASRGMPYRGTLYAGLMVTDDGPFVLEFNVRFGDPETQAVLPLLETDLGELCMAAATGRDLPVVEVVSGACAAVVMASGGYPGRYGRGYPIEGLDRVEDAVVFQAGTALQGEELVTAGGRVLAVSAVGDDLDDALEGAYAGVSGISFRGSFYRRDIGRV